VWGDGPCETLDVTDRAALDALVAQYDVAAVYHLASLLSATGERKPALAWEVNVNGLRHVLEAAREHALRVFWPSSIAAFGPTTPRDPAPQRTILEPTTVYGVTKVTGELLAQYYHLTHGVDVRSLRYPGLISYTAPPGGGTTDYAVAIFHAAAAGERYTCFVRPDTRLPMMYMPDALGATLALMDAAAAGLTVRTSYNVGALSFTAEELAAAIRKRFPDFAVTYAPDFRQQIADSWPAAVDDADARRDWGWAPAYDLDRMVDDMLAHLPVEEMGDRE
jgi:nucleoside-diphosphate-sugar epimerase